MRILAAFCCLLTVLSGIVARASEPCDCPANVCAAQSCSLSPDSAATTVDLDIRVMEFDVYRLMTLGFAFWSVDGPDKPWEQVVAGVHSGPIGLLEAMEREGLVRQDFTFEQRVADGQSWQTVLRWRAVAEKGKDNAWRKLHLRVRPTVLDSGGVRLETGCAADFSKQRDTAADAADMPQGEFSADVADETLCLNAEFVASDPDTTPKDRIRVFVLIKPKQRTSSDENSAERSHPDLLAPRNVLTRQAAHRVASPNVCCGWDQTKQEDAEPCTLELLTDDSLLEVGQDIGAVEILLTPEDDLLAPKLSSSAKAEGDKLFLIQQSDKRKRPKKRRPDAPLDFGGGEVHR